jgi:drug/metabolite transporter (DMT)-like permease
VTTSKTILLTIFAMLAFAANSLLCRQALEHTDIDPALFTAIRIASGALMLTGILIIKGNPKFLGSGSWASAFALSIYAACFSFAYVDLTAATGALLLFTAVQATMLGYGYYIGDRLSAIAISSLLVAFCGFVTLLYPGISSPPVFGSLLMVASGCAWGVYSLRSGSGDPLATTASNFVRATPIGFGILALGSPWLHIDEAGILFAILSGALASGCGYAIWYAALKGLSVTSAATVQLSVPVITATLAVFSLGEPIGIRFVIASVAILGGVAIVIRTPKMTIQDSR